MTDDSRYKSNPSYLESSKNTRHYLLGKEESPALYLTPQEFRCVKELLQDKTYKEIGIALSLSERSVRIYIANVKKRLNCFSRRCIMFRVIKSNLFKHLFVHEIQDKCVDVLNYNALLLLEYLDNVSPTSKQVEFIEDLLVKALDFKDKSK